MPVFENGFYSGVLLKRRPGVDRLLHRVIFFCVDGGKGGGGGLWNVMHHTHYKACPVRNAIVYPLFVF